MGVGKSYHPSIILYERKNSVMTISPTEDVRKARKFVNINKMPSGIEAQPMGMSFPVNSLRGDESISLPTPEELYLLAETIIYMPSFHLVKKVLENGGIEKLTTYTNDARISYSL